MGYKEGPIHGEDGMIVTRLLCLVALAASSTALAHQAQQDASSPPITVTGDKIPPADKMVCKLTNTGTSIPKRICLPKSEWARAEQSTDNTLREMRNFQRVRCNFGSTC